MRETKCLNCNKIRWDGRPAVVLNNGVVQLTTLLGGGHVAEFHLAQGHPEDRINPLWVPPWRTIEPYRYRKDSHPQYGSLTEAKLLSGLAGHSICLDFFGPPSPAETRFGISEHGEAPARLWRVSGVLWRSNKVALRLSVDLPLAQLRFTREIELKKNEPITYFTETVKNQRTLDHVFHWVEHVTLGAPFLTGDHAAVSVSGTRGLTNPHGYDESKPLLLSNEPFRWPHAPSTLGRPIDLRKPFLKKGLGFVAAVLLDSKRRIQFVSAVNAQSNVLVGYCFKRSDFPWVAVWEENCALAAPPWKRRTQARGLEFGTTPFPFERHEALSMGRVFGERTSTVVQARGSKVVRYLAFLTKVPKEFGCLQNLEVTAAGIHLHGKRSTSVLLKTNHAAQFLLS
jgi:hypothetical protein